MMHFQKMVRSSPKQLRENAIGIFKKNPMEAVNKSMWDLKPQNS